MKNMRFFEENNDFLLVGALWNYKGGAWELLGGLGNYKNDSKMLRNSVFLVEIWTKLWNSIIMKKMLALNALDCHILKHLVKQCLINIYIYLIYIYIHIILLYI